MTSAHSLRPNLHVVEPVSPEPLIERAVELEALAEAVRRLAGGGGGVVVLEAAAGLGKTALLEHGAGLARAAGCLVRHAAPGPLESHFCFGVVRALLEAPVRETAGAERARLLAGAAAAAGELLLSGRAPAGDSPMLVAHSVLWLCSALAERRPLALLIDDAQWADRPSLEVLLYLARRIEDLPLLIVVGARADDPDAPSDLLTMLGAARSASLLHPRPLTSAGALALIRRRAPEAPASAGLEGDGNPWLLGELGRQLAVGEPAAGPAPVSEVVRRRVAELCPRDRAVAEALAVLGEDAPLHTLARVAGLSLVELAGARDALIAAGLLSGDGRRFAHGLIAAAIAADLPRMRRERLHQDAASALLAGGAAAGVAASHLLVAGPQGDLQASALLQRASLEAAQRGEPGAAAAFLERALDERAPGDDRAAMLAQLSTVAFDAGLPDSRRRLREALREVAPGAGRVDVLTRLAALNLLDGDDAGLTQLFDRELAGETDPDARLAVEAAALDALMILPDRHAERVRRVGAIDLTRTTDPLLTRVVLAHRAWLGVERGTPDAAACAALALRALDGELLLAEAPRRSAYVISARALVMSDHADAPAALEALHAEAIKRGSVRLRVAAERYRAELALRTGRVAEAENHARLALELVPDDVNLFTGGAIEVLVCALAERGAFADARELLRTYRLDGALGETLWEIGIRHARAQLWLAEGDYERAYAEAVEAGALRTEQGRVNPSLAPWRGTAALALAHLGRAPEAAAVADAELQAAERFGAPTPIAAALHARAVAERDPEARITLCRRALELAPAGGLEAMRVRLELGAALGYLRRRTEAREALRPALADADAAGAVLLADRARRELVATGLRPRQAALEGLAALTPRQRQICELAATGKPNRVIAQELFLSAKTIETHLAASYRKLGVNSRAGLALTLAA